MPEKRNWILKEQVAAKFKLSVIVRFIMRGYI